MSADGVTARERGPRRARYLISKTVPRRAEVIAALATATVLFHLLFAQLTGVIAVALLATTRATRWRRQWLAAPAAAGLLWVLVRGPAGAVTGLLVGPRKVLAYLGGIGGDPSRLFHLGRVFGGVGHWLPNQLPLALVVGSAEAAVAAWLSWLHTDEWKLPPPRAGLIVAVRRLLTTRAVRRGSVVTRDGAALGLATGTGLRAALSWREVAGGVLCAGVGGSGTTTTSFQLVHAAIRRRKPLIAVDLAGDRDLAERFSALCAATATPFYLFGAAGPGFYEPLRGGDPARRTTLVMGMIDWGGAADQYRRSCGAYLHDVFAVIDAAPGDPRVAVIDDVLHLLNPAALRARTEHVPAYHPQRRALLDRIKVSASLFEAEPQAAAVLGEQLSVLRGSTLGRWLRPAPADPDRPPSPAGRSADSRHGGGAVTEPRVGEVSRREGAPGTGIDLWRVVRERGAVLFSLDPSVHGRAAATIASLVAQDIMANCAELRRIGVDGDGLVWFDQCGAVPAGVLADLVARGRDAGLPALLTATSAQTADRLADHVNVLVTHRMTDPAAAERFARLTGEKLTASEFGTTPLAAQPLQGAPAGYAAVGSSGNPGSPAGPVPGAAAGAAPGQGGLTFVRRPVISPETVCDLPAGEFVLVVKTPRRRLVPLGRTVPSRFPHRSGAAPAATIGTRESSRLAAGASGGHGAGAPQGIAAGTPPGLPAMPSSGVSGHGGATSPAPVHRGAGQSPGKTSGLSHRDSHE